MATKLTPADQLMYSAVKLTACQSSVPIGTGTGFFYAIEIGPGQHIVMLMTNKHVLQGAESILATFHVGTGNAQDGPTGEVVTYNLRVFPDLIANHPNPDVDLCGVSLTEMLNHQAQLGKPIFYVNLRSVDIPQGDAWDDFDSIEEVVMVGCPRGIFDEANNIPIMRRGITATPLSKRFNGEDRFVVDMACFPGSSGSPIFIHDRGGYLDRKNNRYMMGAQRTLFVGVLFAGPLISATGKVTLGQPASFEVATMMHLGYALRASAVLEIEPIVREFVRLQYAAAESQS